MILTVEEKTLLKVFGAGTLIPDSKDFTVLLPDIEISPAIDGSCFTRPLLKLGINKPFWRAIYKTTINKKKKKLGDLQWRFYVELLLLMPLYLF